MRILSSCWRLTLASEDKLTCETMKTEIHLCLTQCGASRPGAEMSVYHEVDKAFPSVEEALAYLKEYYGIEKPKRLHDGNSIFVDTDGAPRRIGFLVRRWNSDVSHNSKAWWEENWVSFRAMTETRLANCSVLRELAI
jgi:hypothetical protein